MNEFEIEKKQYLGENIKKKLYFIMIIFNVNDKENYHGLENITIKIY